MNTSSQETDYHKEDVYGEAFDRYEKMLRTWFVAYGIGGPILFLTQDTLRKAFVAAPNARMIGALFLAGVGVQVLESFCYKMCMWHLYYHEAQKDDKCRRLYALSEWVERNCWIDIIFDLSTIALFTIATVMVFPIVYK
jgi:hypothetical protein